MSSRIRRTVTTAERRALDPDDRPGRPEDGYLMADLRRAGDASAG